MDKGLSRPPGSSVDMNHFDVVQRVIVDESHRKDSYQLFHMIQFDVNHLDLFIFDVIIIKKCPFSMSFK